MNTRKEKKQKFGTDLCTTDMTFQDCELAILRQAVDDTEMINQKKTANSPEVSKMIKIVEKFLKDKGCICYGGTAINNILPKESQFYNREIEIPDYDFFSPTPLSHAKELADIYFNAGYTDVEAKSGVHAGTFKVFVNFIPMADITELHPDIFNNISKEAIVKQGIKYCPANFLRMNMFLELSRPEGDVSRWEKVLKRLTLLNNHYPLHNKHCYLVDFQRTMNSMDSIYDSERLYYLTRDHFIDEKSVFFGGYASSLYTRYMPHAQKRLVRAIPDFDVLHDDPKMCAAKLVKKMTADTFSNVTIKEHQAIGEIVPFHVEVKVGDDTVCFIYKPMACHSYNELIIRDKHIRVATIDTMLTLYLAFYYADRDYYSHFKERLLCMSQFLFMVEQRNRLSQHGLLKRFSIKCYGKQPTLETMRSEKAKKFTELRNKRGTDEYEYWFLKYTPGEKKSDSILNNRENTPNVSLKTPNVKTPTVPQSETQIDTDVDDMKDIEEVSQRNNSNISNNAEQLSHSVTMKRFPRKKKQKKYYFRKKNYDTRRRQNSRSNNKMY